MGISTFANVVAQEQSVYRGKQLILWTVPTRFMFRLCISAWVYLDLRYGRVLFSDRRALDALLEVISQVSSTPKGTGAVQPWLPGRVSQTRARGNKPTICFKNTVLIQNQTWRKALLPTKLTLPPHSAQAWRVSYRHGCWQHPAPRSFLAPSGGSKAPRDPSSPKVAGTLLPWLLLPYVLGLSRSPMCRPWYAEKFWGPFFGLRVDGLTRLALSSYCPQCDHQTRSISPQVKHKHLVKRKTLKTPIAAKHLLEVYRDPWGFISGLDFCYRISTQLQ